MNITKAFLLALFQGFYLGSLCQRWEFPSEMVALIGHCVEIPCIYVPDKVSEKSSTVWYLYDRVYYMEIFNSRTSSSVKSDYISRTSLVPGGSCSLRIDPVRREDKGLYYPGVAGSPSKNAYELHGRRSIGLDVTDSPGQPALTGSGEMMEGKTTIIYCHTDHTCASSRPLLQWNKPGLTKSQSVQLSGGRWREVSELTYIPSYVDDRTSIRCTVTYHRGLRSQAEAILNIKYPPKAVTVSLIGSKELTEGSDVTLSCGSSISKPPATTYEWYKGKNKTKLQIRGLFIRISDVRWDTEPYSCTAINEVGRGDSALIEIPVQYAPRKVHIIPSEPREGVIELWCDFLGSRPNVTHYSWMKDKALLLNEIGQILFVNRTEKNSRNYSCIAHNKAGSSASEEIHFKADDQNPNNQYGDDNDFLLEILLALGGVLLILLILFIYFYVRRRNSKSAHGDTPILGTNTRIPFPHMMGQDQIIEEEPEYGNVQGTRTPSSSDKRLEDNNAIYSNEEFMHSFAEVEYSAIAHRQNNQTRQSHLTSNQEELVEYAAVRR